MMNFALEIKNASSSRMGICWNKKKPTILLWIALMITFNDTET